MKKYLAFGATALLAFALVGCGDKEKTSSETNKTAVEEQSGESKTTETETAKEQTITYLGNEYVLPGKVENIVAASLESMEDAAILGIKPTGVLSIGGEIPAYLKSELDGATLIGDKREPNNEAILGLNPDVILGSSKYTEEVAAKLNKIQTMIPYSHISTNWKENLTLLGHLTGTEAKANEIITNYDEKAKESKAKLSDSLADSEILIIRIRGGAMFLYPQDVYLNPVIYEDLGAKVPEIIAQTKAQEEISLETLADVNPDYIFLQFETTENADAPNALDELLKNPIFSSIEAAKNEHVFVNEVDPLAQGGTAWSKVKFLDAAINSLLK